MATVDESRLMRSYSAWPALLALWRRYDGVVELERGLALGYEIQGRGSALKNRKNTACGLC